MGGIDTNLRVAALLQDLASVQTSKQKQWGYTRAASAIRNLDRPIESLIRSDGTLTRIPNVGPASTRVIMEVLAGGGSAIVEQAVAGSGRAIDADRRRGLREGFLSRAQVAAVLEDTALKGPRLADYRGDLQMHSEWSDGSETLEALVEGCLARGYRYCAVTDHSYGLKIARGMSMAAMTKQHREIDALNRRYRGRFRLIKGIEANIRADGGVDMTPEELGRLELVLAAPHSKLRIAVDQTARMVAAVRQPGVHILAHPSGRKFGARAGLVADWPQVFAAAAERQVAIEIDGDPARQDLDGALAHQAVNAGCHIALNSDAHSVAELANAETAIAHARLAGIPRSRIVNCWEVDRLLAWLRR